MDNPVHIDSAFAQHVNRAFYALEEKGHAIRLFENGKELWQLTEKGKKYMTDHPEIFDKLG